MERFRYYCNIEDYRPYDPDREKADAAEMVPAMKEYMERIADLCREKKIRLILTLTPSTDATLSKHAAIQAFANEQGVEFFDFNTAEVIEQMQYDDALSTEDVTVYSLSFKAAEGTPYQIVSGLMGETGEIETEPAWADDAYLQKNVEGQWVRYPGEDGDNTLTHEDANILYDLRAEDLRWARCDDSPLEHVVLRVNLPAENCPEAVEIIGGFDAWEGTAMEKLDNGLFFVEFDAKASQFFKFRSAVLKFRESGGF